MINRKYTHESFISLYNQGLSDGKIAEILSVTGKTIQSYRTKLKLPIQLFKYKPTDFQKSILIGTLLGDGHLKKDDDCYNVNGSINHSGKQELYAKYKYELLKELCNSKVKMYKSKTPDKRNGNIYDTWNMYFRSNEYLNWYYENLYINGKKRITKEILDYFNELSLSFLFMDDGYKSNSGGYYIATMCFLKEDIQLLVNKLKEWNIKSSIDKDNRLYISAKSQEIFNKIVSKYMIPSMKYKLHKSAVRTKQGELLENPTLERQKEDNQQPSLGSNSFEGSTTNIQYLTSNVEVGKDNTSALPFNIDSNGFSTIIIDDNIVKWKPMKGIDY